MFYVIDETVLYSQSACSSVPVSYTHLDVYKRQLLYINILLYVVNRDTLAPTNFTLYIILILYTAYCCHEQEYSTKYN